MKKIRLILLICLLFLVPWQHVHAASDDYVIDDQGLLTSSQLAELNELAGTYAEKNGIGFYVRIKNSHGSQSIEAYAESIYISEGLGIGDSKDGIMLLLTMEDRSFDIVEYGEKAEKFFSASARESIAEVVIYDYISGGDYFNGFKAFFEECQSTITTSNSIKGMTAVGVPSIIAAIYTWIMRRKNKTKGIAHTAAKYIPKNGIKLNRSTDYFLYQTTTRVYDPPVKKSSGGSGFHSSSSSGGFGHTSGHF